MKRADRAGTVSGMQPLAVGRTAEVYGWGDGRILKLLRPEIPAAIGEIEISAARTVVDAGLAAPRLLETLEVDGRLGLVYERIDGRSMLEALSAQPWRLWALARQFAHLHAAMHDSSASGLPELKGSLERMIGRAGTHLPAAGRDAALKRLSSLPEGKSIAHGDMHPGNVILTARGPMVIDWMTATRGDPAADVARTTYLLAGAVMPDDAPRIQRLAVSFARRRFLAAYLAEYRRIRPLEPGLLARWRLPIYAARLGEGIGAEEERLLAGIRAELAADQG